VIEGDRLRLQHIIEAAERIESYPRRRTREAFLAEPLLQDAVVRNLEVIGEAATGVSPALRQCGARRDTLARSHRHPQPATSAWTPRSSGRPRPRPCRHSPHKSAHCCRLTITDSGRLRRAGHPACAADAATRSRRRATGGRFHASFTPLVKRSRSTLAGSSAVTVTAGSGAQGPAGTTLNRFLAPMRSTAKCLTSRVRILETP